MKSSAGPLTLAQKVEQSAYLTRFFAKLLGEVLYLKADSARFKPQEQGLRISILCANNEIKSLTIKSDWCAPLLEWLCERFLTFGASADPQASRPSWSASREPRKPLDFMCAFSPEEACLLFRVGVEPAPRSKRPAPAALTLSEAVAQSRTYAHAQLGVLDQALPQFHEVIAPGPGLVIVSAPDDLNVQRSVAGLLSLSPAHYLGDWLSVEDFGGLLELAQKELLVSSLKAESCVDAALKVANFMAHNAWPRIRAVVQQGFVKRTCEFCARQTAPDKSLVAALPDGLKDMLPGVYLAGRGCEKCGQAGYRGLIALQSILLVDGNVREALANPGEQAAALVEYAFRHGTRPLLEDGIHKIAAGKTTLEYVFELTKVVPAAFSKFYEPKPPALKPAGAAMEAKAEPPQAEPKIFRANVKLTDDEDIPIINIHPERLRPLLLVVEDDPDQRTILEMVFKSANYDVKMAGDGIEALATLRQELPDLIILDLMMPRMDGQEFVSRLKMDKNYKNIPILVLTVVADADKEYNLLDLGAEDYCEKTIQRKVLLKRIENLLKRRKVE